MITVQIKLDLGTEELNVHRTVGYRMADNPAVIASASLNQVVEDARTWLACRAPQTEPVVPLDSLLSGDLPSLPFLLEGEHDIDRIEVGTGEDSAYPTLSREYPIRIVVGPAYTHVNAAAAEQFGLALIAAAREIRAREEGS